MAANGSSTPAPTRPTKMADTATDMQMKQMKQGEMLRQS